MEIIEYAYAKINLTLRILPTRSDGFHGVETIMAPIDLYDTIKVSKANEFKIVGVDIPNNIMERVAKIFFAKYNLDGLVKLEIEKRIPVAAGLAGGSSDAAATLRALNRYYGLNLALGELEEICNQVGSDVSYCLYQKLAYCSGRGEIVDPKNISFKKIPLLLIKPDFSLSTALVYKNYEYFKRSYDPNLIFKALEMNDIEALKANVFNDLEAPAKKLEPSLVKLAEFVNNLGYEIYQSGSGPSYFILDFDDYIYNKVRDEFPNYFILKTTLGIE